MANDPSASKGRTGLQSFKIPQERFISAPVEAILQDLQGILRSLTLTGVYKREVSNLMVPSAYSLFCRDPCFSTRWIE